MKPKDRKPIGRPPIDPTGSTAQVRLRITGAVYDAVYQRASEAGLDVPSMLRNLIVSGLYAERYLPHRRPSY